MSAPWVAPSQETIKLLVYWQSEFQQVFHRSMHPSFKYLIGSGFRVQGSGFGFDADTCADTVTRGSHSHKGVAKFSQKKEGFTTHLARFFISRYFYGTIISSFVHLHTACFMILAKQL